MLPANAPSFNLTSTRIAVRSPTIASTARTIGAVNVAIVRAVSLFSNVSLGTKPAINAMAPFVLNARLTTLLEKSAAMDGNSKRAAFIVNVSAMEGKFYRYKTPNHPHTNMAKAALNMMTATSAADYANDNVYMNAVDTGWINDENPMHVAARIAKEHEFQTPIDEEDAAARCVAPILEGVRDAAEPPFGKFFKDYAESEW